LAVVDAELAAHFEEALVALENHVVRAMQTGHGLVVASVG
jgi:hypothetical protein